MSRRKSFSGILTQIARDQARAARQAEVAQRRYIREREQAERAAIKQKAQLDKDAKQRYIESQLAEVESMNSEVSDRLDELNQLLVKTLSVNDAIPFPSLRQSESFPPFKPFTELTTPAMAPVREQYFAHIKPLGGLGKLIPGAQERHQKAEQSAEDAFRTAHLNYVQSEESRKEKLKQAENDYESQKQAHLNEVRERNLIVDQFEQGYRSGDPDAVVAYCSMVLERSKYPSDFPQEFRVAYVPESKEIVVEYELPSIDVIPQVIEYKYVKSKDLIEEKPRKSTEIKTIYQDMVSSICLRTIHELIESDQCEHLMVVVFNGFVQTVDPSTGRDIRPCLISIRATRPAFLELDLSRIDKRACLRNLGAQVSPSPAEMLPVKPIIEFDMVDKRFMEQSDILGDLDTRPNLMELSPFDFENLVSNLFQRMGLETKQTQSSRDGGVDAVAFDTRPILGGKVIIQAKRYKNTVGVSAVRDLYGTMLNEGGNKGILVTTSSYGPDAYQFAKDKPIELIDGGGLLYLLNEVGVKAKIIMPEE